MRTQSDILPGRIKTGAVRRSNRAVRLIPSRKIRDGVELARDIVAGPPGMPAAAGGCKLSARYAELLPKAGVGSVWIEDDLGVDIDIAEPLSIETRAKVHKATGAAITAAGIALRAGSGMPSAIVESSNDVAGAMVDDLLDFPTPRWRWTTWRPSTTTRTATASRSPCSGS